MLWMVSSMRWLLSLAVNIDFHARIVEFHAIVPCCGRRVPCCDCWVLMSSMLWLLSSVLWLLSSMLGLLSIVVFREVILIITVCLFTICPPGFYQTSIAPPTRPPVNITGGDTSVGDLNITWVVSDAADNNLPWCKTVFFLGCLHYVCPTYAASDFSITWVVSDAVLICIEKTNKTKKLWFVLYVFVCLLFFLAQTWLVCADNLFLFSHFPPRNREAQGLATTCITGFIADPTIGGLR